MSDKELCHINELCYIVQTKKCTLSNDKKAYIHILIWQHGKGASIENQTKSSVYGYLNVGWKVGSEFRNLSDDIFKMLTKGAKAQAHQFPRFSLLWERIWSSYNLHMNTGDNVCIYKDNWIWKIQSFQSALSNSLIASASFNLFKETNFILCSIEINCGIPQKKKLTVVFLKKRN